MESLRQDVDCLAAQVEGHLSFEYKVRRPHHRVAGFHIQVQDQQERCRGAAGPLADRPCLLCGCSARMTAFLEGGGVEAYPEFRPGVDSVKAYFERMFSERIVIYDGAMGTMIQKHKLTEEDYRVGP